VWVVAELAQHPRAQHRTEPGLLRRIAASGWALNRAASCCSEAATCWLQQRSMLVAAAKHGHQGADHLAVGRLDWLKCRKLRCRQRVVDGHHLGLQVAPPASPEQRPPHRCAGEPPALLGGWRQLEHRQRLEFAQLGAHCDQRARENSRNALRNALTCRCRLQIRLWCARARTLTASASGLSPATGRWLWRSVRTSSASTLASPRSDLARELPCRPR
jgi:hypothetical protein